LAAPRYCRHVRAATYKLTWEEIVALYRLALGAASHNFQPRFNVCPTTKIDAVVERDGKRTLDRMRWGLVSSWWSEPLKELKLATFNARAETVATKPMFRSTLKRNRCLTRCPRQCRRAIPRCEVPRLFAVRRIAGLWDE
jgi:putative SOS response-associated peptidase YedK